ncbi:MoxR family ATPase (plasmid) [Haloferax mediterranei ATCC 33500]|uniref:ATPase n=1 Tax=Haloferax mediterranei (strain ATCC 33500 / DSM 1411 / JCM 8866 / NBRC 14739 / NCIMB 2177 / R-4) TaxID=523841 RepID=I3RA26_HALMT|nr:MoxR family ATPase [Haloferax mediterranei]AFK21086.1 methanol dehydrogenase regulatory protein [Haloferax mediterranei ATCC 33500]AHZ24325.1 ATPase [Haloferax mediterranei ATCC 33500]EMA05411.1 methanol dehydrogenase regulatory protein [Haloferax mediterranei ATCC 33500]MDX5989791.1 MoxR family ATPase [Haloferax mediterranei ATCC 33500]QCQ77235.1 MoxR family ATPase [Haloferax mediterranei ATCC 33500]
MDPASATEYCESVLKSVETAVVADQDFLETVLVGVVSDGHILLEDVPGTGKTLTAKSFATALGLEFSRVQFTPDLLPSDIVGTHIYNEAAERFEFTRGPIFANVVLADEINRAPPKTQAALLEAMAEGQVTVDGDTYPLPDPFFVIATQNPVESEGVFPLPEAQIDRFTIKTTIGYPETEAENRLLRRRTNRDTSEPTVTTVLSPEEVRDLQSVPESVRVHDDLISYITSIAQATRNDPQVRVGVSPRGTQRLLETARSRAVFEGREFVKPADVKAVARPVLAHRLVLTPDASIEETSKSDVISDILDTLSVPKVSLGNA